MDTTKKVIMRNKCDWCGYSTGLLRKASHESYVIFCEKCSKILKILERQIEAGNIIWREI